MKKKLNKEEQRRRTNWTNKEEQRRRTNLTNKEELRRTKLNKLNKPQDNISKST